MRVQQKALTVRCFLGLMVLTVPHATAQVDRLTGNWEEYTSQRTFSMKQNRTAVTMDLGNGITLEGTLKVRALSLSHALTEADVRRLMKIREESGPREKEAVDADVEKLTGKTVKLTGSLNSDLVTIEATYEFWVATTEGGKTSASSVSAGLELHKLKNCCCVEDVVIEGIAPKTRDQVSKSAFFETDEDPVEVRKTMKAQFGHQFEVRISFHNHYPKPGEEPGDCVLQWLEKSDKPPGSNLKAGVRANQWFNIGDTVGPLYPQLFKEGTLAPWVKHSRNATTPGLKSEPVTLTDVPTVFYDNSRTMYFHIIVSSAANGGCTHPRKEAWAKQVLDEAPKGIDHPKSKTEFYNGAKE